MNWEIVRLDNAVTIMKGKKPNLLKNIYSSGFEIPYITIEAFENQKAFQYTNSTLNIVSTEKNDILIVWDGARFGLIGKSFGGALGSTLAKISPKEFINNNFLYYFLSKNYELIRANQRGSGIPHIDGQYLRSIFIPIPALSEQNRIVEILEQADDIRRKKKKVIEKSEKMITNFFYKMFGDPLAAKEFINIESLVEKIERRNPAIKSNEEIKYIDISGVSGIKGEITNVKSIMGSEAPSRARQILNSKDIIISTVRPYLRATALIPENLDNQICSTGFCVLRAKNKTGYGFLYALSRLNWFTQRLNNLSRGASYPAVSDSDILSLEIPKPNFELLENFDKLVDKIQLLKQDIQKSSDKLNLTFESIQHSAFNGELTKEWREKNNEQISKEIAERNLKYGF